MEKVKRILICRSDGIGDLVLTLPLFKAARAAFPNATISALVSPASAPLLEGNPDVDSVILDDQGRNHKGPAGYMRLSKLIDAGDFDTALAPYANWRLLSLIVAAGIKRRVANGFRSYLPLVNKPVWIHRSHPPIHETTYCLAFLRPLGVDVASPAMPRIYLRSDEREWISQFLASKGVNKDDKTIALNPGSGRTMSPDRWVRIADIAGKRTGADKILVTGALFERSHCERIAAALGDRAIVLAGELDLRRFCALAEQLDLLIAPHCGELQLASAMDTKVLGLYSQLRSLSAEKWHPLGNKVATITPFDMRCKKCKHEKCDLFPCLDYIKDEAVGEALSKLLEKPD